MARYQIQFRDGPSLEIEASGREPAWDAYKAKTGLRRTVFDQAPSIIEIPEVLHSPVPDATAATPAPESIHGPDLDGHCEPHDEP